MLNLLGLVRQFDAELPVQRVQEALQGSKLNFISLTPIGELVVLIVTSAFDPVCVPVKATKLIY